MPRTKRRGVPNLGERITSFMEASNLDASELSARTGISVSYLTRILRGEVVNPTIDFVIRLAAGLGVTETQLLREVGDGQTVGQGQQASSSRSESDLLAATGTFGSPGSLMDDQERQPPTFEEQVRQILTSANLPYAKRIIAQQMGLEAFRIICWGLKKAEE